MTLARPRIWLATVASGQEVEMRFIREMAGGIFGLELTRLTGLGRPGEF